MPRRHRHSVGWAGAALIIAAACGGTDPAPVASVDVTPGNDTVRAGTSINFLATPRDADGAALAGRTTTWLSSDPTIATVNSVGLVTGVNNGVASISAAVEGQSGSASVRVWVGTTGTWAGSVDASGNVCDLTQSLTEATDGSIAGSGTLGSPCTPGSYTIVGNNDVDAVADSVVTNWTGTFALVLSGTFDGDATISGFITGGGCTGTTCPFSFTRSDLIPTLRTAPQAPATPGDGPLGTP